LKRTYILLIRDTLTPETEADKDLLLIALMSSPAIANTFVPVAQLRYQHDVDVAKCRILFDV